MRKFAIQRAHLRNAKNCYYFPLRLTVRHAQCLTTPRGYVVFFIVLEAFYMLNTGT